MKTKNKEREKQTMADRKALTDEELANVSGGNFPITYTDMCHYDPTRFLDACDPRYWNYNECARCAYNAHRLWKDSYCTYPNIEEQK